MEKYILYQCFNIWRPWKKYQPFGRLDFSAACTVFYLKGLTTTQNSIIVWFSDEDFFLISTIYFLWIFKIPHFRIHEEENFQYLQSLYTWRVWNNVQLKKSHPQLSQLFSACRHRWAALLPKKKRKTRPEVADLAE